MKRTTISATLRRVLPRILPAEDLPDYAAFLKEHGSHNGVTTMRRINGTRITTSECVEHGVRAVVRVAG